MKSTFFYIFPLGLLFLMSSCSNRDNSHRDLINYLDSGSHHFNLDSSISDDAAIISLLEEVSKYNKSLKESKRKDSTKVDAIKYFKNLVGFRNYLMNKSEIEKIYTDTIDIISARLFHNNYTKAREDAAKLPNSPDGIKIDSTEATLFTLPKLIAALHIAYDPKPEDWVDTSWWRQKGFFIFPSNYGSKGHNNSNSTGSDKWQTSAILQFAEDVEDTNDTVDLWKVKENQLFNFGDLKPPKIQISNSADSPEEQ